MSAALALVGLLVHVGLLFGVQEVVQRRRTGRSSWVDPRRKGRAERAADALFVLAAVLVLGSPALVVAGALDPMARVMVAGVAGAVLIVLATVAAKWAQAVMGAAWRTGVAGEDSGRLVVGGAFAWVRNPVYTALMSAATGAALLAPTAMALLGVAALVLALQVQTRAVEEPHLRRVHGERYAAYAARVGRFLPGVGRLT